MAIATNSPTDPIMHGAYDEASIPEHCLGGYAGLWRQQRGNVRRYGRRCLKAAIAGSAHMANVARDSAATLMRP